MNKLKISVILLLLVSIFNCSSKSTDNSSGDNSGNNPGTSTNPNEGTNFIISSYIRGDLYNRGRISVENMSKCNDLICLGVTPAADGSLIFENFNLYNGEGVSNFTGLVKSVKDKLSGDIRVRMGISGGVHWKSMITNSSAVTNFCNNVLFTLQTHNMSGVDIDFEWCYTEQEFTLFSNLINSLRNTIGNNYILSVSLSPVSYKINKNAIEAADYISLQCYGPSPERFPYDEYTSNIQEVIKYGISSSKLIPGLPFFGVAKDGSKETAAYYSFVTENLITSASQSETTLNGVSYIFNGQNEITAKTNYAKNQRMPGIMFWDLADDVTVSNPKSLLLAITNSN